MTNYKELAMLFNKEMNFNVLPLKWKRPMIQWDKWQEEIQTEEDISKMDMEHGYWNRGNNGNK